MTTAADLVLTNGEVHALTDPDEVHEAVAVRDGRVVRVDSAYEVAFLEGAETDVVDLDGRVLLPGFVDAHTHMEELGRRVVHADLSDASSPADAVELLAGSAREDSEWVQGFGYDESAWEETRYLTRGDLDAVSEDRPVVAFREDMHTASLNSVALDRLVGAMDSDEMRRRGGEPTGVVVEGAAGVVREATAPGPAETRDLLLAARDYAHEHGVTAVHDMVRQSHAPRVYRDLEADGELRLRVRLNYWSDHLDAVLETGLRTNAGSEWVQVGAIKTFTDGSIGARTARLSEPYDDAEEDGSDPRGQWVVSPEELRGIVSRADDAGLQVTAHAIGDVAIRETLAAFAEESEDPASARHRVEHAEVLTDDLVERFAGTGVVASVQPNFLKWAREGGLYESRLGVERTRDSNRFGALRAAGVPLAFGSDTMPMGPLFGVGQTVTAPDETQRVGVTEALRAYTRGAAYAGFDEDRMGTVEPGKVADLVALDASPWDVDPGEIAGIDVALTVVGGEVVYRSD